VSTSPKAISEGDPGVRTLLRMSSIF